MGPKITQDGLLERDGGTKDGGEFPCKRSFIIYYYETEEYQFDHCDEWVGQTTSKSGIG